MLFPQSADAKDTADIYLDNPVNYKITNNVGESVIFPYPTGDYLYEIDGDMEIVKYDDGVIGGEFDGFNKLVVKDSDIFTFTPIDGKPFEDFYVEMFSKKHERIYVNSKFPQKVEIVGNGAKVISEPGSSCIYSFGGYMPKQKISCAISGVVIGQVEVSDSSEGIILRGAGGRTSIIVANKDRTNDYGGERHYYLFGDKVLIKYKKGKVIVTPGIYLSETTRKNVRNLYLRPVNGGKNMFLTWSRVKKAKSYVIYKYDPTRKKYTIVGTRNGHGSNYYNVAHARNDEIYKYYIQPKSKKGGRGKNVCKRSYAVWSVAGESGKGNTTSVTTNKKSIKGKVGKSAKLKATVTTSAKDKYGNIKPLLSKSIRWYSSNKKIAVVNKKTGKVKFKKKGKCYIWAKAHNGKNSKKIKVNVK